MGEDQDAAGARGLDEAERGDRLAGAGRVLEPEAAVGVRDPRAARRAGRPRRARSSSCQSCGSSSSASLVVRRARRPRRRRARRPRRGIAARRQASAGSRRPVAGGRCCRCRRRCRCAAPRPAARSACPDSASTWWAESTVPSARCGSSSESSRSSPSSSENLRRHSIEGWLAPAVELGQRSVERPAARGAGGERVLEGLALVDEALAREQLRTRDRGRTRKRGGITHADRKVASRCASRGRYVVRLRRSRLEAEHGEVTLRSGAPSPPWLEDSAYLSRCEADLAGSRAPSLGRACGKLSRASAVAVACWLMPWRSRRRVRSASRSEAPPQSASTPRSRARRRRSPRCTRRPTSCSAAGRRRSRRGSRACAATRWSSTSGRRGAGRARPSSRRSSGRRCVRAQGRVHRDRRQGPEPGRRRVPAQFPVTYPSYVDPHETSRARSRPRPTIRRRVLRPPRQDRVRPRRAVPSAARSSRTSAATCSR